MISVKWTKILRSCAQRMRNTKTKPSLFSCKFPDPERHVPRVQGTEERVSASIRPHWKAPREHRGKCGGRAWQPRGQLTGGLWEVPPAFACRGSRTPPRSSACRLIRHGGANLAEGTQGAPRKMRRQGAATPGPTHRVSVGCAPSLRLPRQSHTSPLRYFPPAPMPSAARDRKMIRNDPAPKFVQTAIHSLIQTRR